jgi:leucyl-tRNA synthetase
MKGFNVLHPMGWDAFGLPAENYAIKTGIHPKITTENNVANIKRQMQITGLSYDWSREINTTDPNYYKWTQWIFLQLYKNGLAYEDEAPINWCPKDKTGLANEEVVNGKCDRCGTQVERKVIRQWILKITDYAERLLADLDGLDWPEFIKEMQVNWIGKSEGLIFTAPVKDTDLKVQTFSAHFEACYADTFVVIAPDHPFLAELIKGTPTEDKVLLFSKQLVEKRLARGFEEEKESEGIFTGRFISDPLGNGDLPIWVSSYALADYGTGIVKCSAHDARDFAFAKKYNIPLKVILLPPNDSELRSKVEKLEICYSDMKNGILTEPKEFAGQRAGDLREQIASYVIDRGYAEKKVSYKLRDWIFSRQRYWGEPIPLIHCENCGTVPVPDDQLPLVLPEVAKYEPTGTGESPLAVIEDWVNTTCPNCQGPAKRETNTMPQWAGSCWYYLRFCDPDNNSQLISSDIERYLLPVDWYLGGAEHAVLHLLYARFWHKFLYDIKVVGTKEPFLKLSSIGLVLGPDGAKMSKSKGNVISPESVIAEYGADTLRMYESFMGPF